MTIDNDIEAESVYRLGGVAALAAWMRARALLGVGCPECAASPAPGVVGCGFCNDTKLVHFKIVSFKAELLRVSRAWNDALDPANPKGALR